MIETDLNQPLPPVQIGNLYGCLLVIGRDTTVKGRSHWLCRCGCGKVTSKDADNLRKRVRRCSKTCMLLDQANQPYTPHPSGMDVGRYRRPLNDIVSWGRAKSAEGEDVVICTVCGGGRFFAIPWAAFAAEKVKTPQELADEQTWDALKGTRQSWKDMKQRCTDKRHYPEYAGIITYPPDWDFFEVFLNDMGLRPSEAHSIHRIGSGNYGPGLCEWADDQQQSQDRRPFKSYAKLYADALSDDDLTI